MGCVPMVEIAGQKYPVDIMNTSVLINVPEILTRQEGQCSNLVGFFTVEVGYMPNPTVSATVFHVTSMKAPKNPDLCFK